jgi:hypothetical protein
MIHTLKPPMKYFVKLFLIGVILDDQISSLNGCYSRRNRAILAGGGIGFAIGAGAAVLTGNEED